MLLDVNNGVTFSDLNILNFQTLFTPVSSQVMNPCLLCENKCLTLREMVVLSYEIVQSTVGMRDI